MVVILLLVPSSSSASLTTPTFTTTVSTTPKNHYHNSYSYPSPLSSSPKSTLPTPLPKNHDHFTPSRVTFTTQPQQSNGNAAPDRNRNYTREFVNHVTRINISNDFSQTKVGDGQLDAVVKEEEVITKRKTELTTTKQIETRIKRQVKFEDGKVIEDSGPVVSTATTEDTDKVESEQVEKKTVPPNDSHDAVDSAQPLEFTSRNVSKSSPRENLIPFSTNNDNNVQSYAASRDDGLIREIKENRVVSREDTIKLTEVEDVNHLGDFSDAAYVRAVNSGSENIEKILLSPDAKLQLVPTGPRLIKNIVNKHKTVDSEDTELKFIRQADGTLVTEKKKTTEHDEVLDEDLPDADDNQSTGSKEKILKHKESSQRFVKQRAEQEVEYVSDGKVIAKEMRYAAENDYMERDGTKEDEADWDSLSDRVKKSRRLAQKTLLLKQRENTERKDALTNRPLDFDREEETRRKETYKWLDNHFGSESTSRDSRESTISDIVAEPTKKSFFNVTIKTNGTKNDASPANGHHIITSNIQNSINSNLKTTAVSTSNLSTSHHRQSKPSLLSNENDCYTSKLTAPAKLYMPEREETPKKFFQGISDWSERKDSRTSLGTPLGTKAFRDELASTLERKQRAMKIQSSSNPKHMEESTTTATMSNYRSKSREDLMRLQKEDLGYLSGSRTDLRPTPVKKYTNDDYAVPIKKKTTTNGFLHREDSGFRESKEDLRSPPHREDSFGRVDAKQTSIQRDDSAYVSSSTYFTSPRSPQRPRSPLIETPDSGVRSPTPNFESDEISQPPCVPQRKKNIERTSKVSMKNEDYANYPAKPRRDPPIDYMPPPVSRSRSVSPAPIHHIYHDRKPYQKTRFSSPPSTPNTAYHRSASVSAQTQTHTPLVKKKSFGSSISNSLRKFVGKIRSASAERKAKSKTPTKRSQSPLAPITKYKSVSNLPSSSYQRTDYVIDSHIGNGINFRAPSTSTQASTNFRRERTFDHIERSGSSTTDNEMPISSSERVTHHSNKKTLITSPKQRYYLGEDPYSGHLFGKENKNVDFDYVSKKNIYNNSSAAARRQRSEEPRFNSNSTSTLGRFSKSTNRLASHDSNRYGSGYISAALQESNDNYRSTQTLPRKLDHKNHKPISQSTINVSIVNNVKHPLQNTGPAKPARTYKSIQRSKSFNVHGMNGTNDPSPIYMEKLTNNNYRNHSNGHYNHHNRESTESPSRVVTTTTHHTKIYKSTPHLIEPAGDIMKLKSPSIVNLISRSTKDLTALNDHPYIDRRYNASSPLRITPEFRSKNDIGYTKSYHDDDEYVSRNIKFVERESLGSKGSSRSSPIVVKDSGTILRRGSNSTDNENYTETYKYQTKSSDLNHPSVTDCVETFSKKVIPEEIDDRTKKETTIERHEIKKVTTSRGFPGSPSPPNLKYYDVNHNRNGNVVIELKNNY